MSQESSWFNEVYSQALELLVADDAGEVEKLLREIVEWERAHPPTQPYDGFEWYAVHGQPQTLNALVTRRVLSITLKSNKYTCYRLLCREAVEKALADFSGIVEVREEEVMEIPEDLFSVVVGYEDIKAAILKSLASEKPVSCLMVGPAATAKSLILEELNRIPGASYHLGSSATKAGLTQFLLRARPRLVLIDELDKMSREDYASLLSLMESGKVVETKFGRRSEEYMRVGIFASCNGTKGIPPENLSRFPFQFHLREYTPEEFVEVVVKVLTEREGIEIGLSQYIANKLATSTRDVRKAIGLARVCTTQDEVDQIIKTLKKYRGI